MNGARAFIAVGLAFALVGCGSSGSDTSATPETSAAVATVVEKPVSAARSQTLAVDGRTFTVNVPAEYDVSSPLALIVALHGYTANGLGAKAFFGLEPLADERRFLTVYPDGTKDTQGNTFWNATNACCNFASSETDDSAFLAALIDEVGKNFAVDPKRVFFVGHSNGGFMSYRMACEHADRIAAIVSVAGATYDDANACTPSQPVNIAQVHGTSDDVISFAGGSILANTYPSAKATVATWAQYNGCNPKPDGGIAKSLDLDGNVDDDDSTVSAFLNCKPGGAVELWTIDGGAHSPKFTAEFATSVIDFFYAHPKP